VATQKIVAGSAKNNFIPWLFITPALLLAAHVMAGIALFTFGQRVGNLPINPVGLAVYLTTTISLGIAFLIGTNRARRGLSFLRMLLLSLPAFASLALHATFWLTGWLGNGPYAPWKVGGDSGTVIYLNLIFVFSWIVIATIYGSYKYLLTGGIIQIAVYFAAYALPHLSRFPEASPLGVQPEVPIQFVGLLVLGGFLVAGRKWAFLIFNRRYGWLFYC
jgi:hypothetical protein